MEEIDNKKPHSGFANRLHECFDERDNYVPPHKRAGTLVEWFSGSAPIKTQTAYTWLKGDKLPYRSKMPLLTEKLGVREEWLVYGKLPKRVTAEMKKIVELLDGLSEEKCLKIREMLEAMAFDDKN